MKTPEILVKGKDNGEGMVIRYRTSRGTDVYGLAIPNIFMDADWDLGPTWCYLITKGRTTLIDTGRFGNFEVFVNLLKSIGKKPSDIDRIIITHSHEDHDGNLAEVQQAAQSELWAHSIYRSMIGYHPKVKSGRYPDLPGSCRFCAMPEKHHQQCLPYHQKRSTLSVAVDIHDDQTLPGDGLTFVFTPGHSPDSLCIVLDNEVIFTGDTLLPDITPHPSLVSHFEANRSLLPENYQRENSVYGLRIYVKSLHKIAHLYARELGTFPAHRLFYNGQFNLIHSAAERAGEIIQFHSDRCRDILSIIEKKPAEVEEIIVQHFEPSLLAGYGRLLAHNEVIAHLELMEECGDIRWDGEKKDLVKSTGSTNFLGSLQAYLV